MIGFLTLGPAATTYQPIPNRSTYATNTKVDTIYYNLHQTAVKKLDVKNGIAAHVQQTGHTVRWSEAKYIDQHNYYVNRKMKEAIYINAYAPG